MLKYFISIYISVSNMRGCISHPINVLSLPSVKLYMYCDYIPLLKLFSPGAYSNPVNIQKNSTLKICKLKWKQKIVLLLVQTLALVLQLLRVLLHGYESFLLNTFECAFRMCKGVPFRGDED